MAANIWPELPNMGNFTFRACLEKVHAMPGQGVTSMFTFGENFGFWKGFLAAHKVPYVLTTPQVWMKEILDHIPDRLAPMINEDVKSCSRRRARNTVTIKTAVVSFVKRTMPGSEIYFKYKKNWGIADAVCMALYARKKDVK